MKKEDFYAEARSNISGPLSGITVVEATTTWSGPMAGCVLADFGARVIKIEHPNGDVFRRVEPRVPNSDLAIFNETVNRNKESLSIDLHTEPSQAIVHELIKSADIFIENFRPGKLAEWNLGYQDLKRIKPDLVYVSISGYGQFGSLINRAAYDPMIQSISGWASLNGDPEGMPTRAASFLGDDLSGLHAALGAMAALRHRDQCGEGQHVDVAMLDSLAFQSNGFPTAGALGVDLPRQGNQFEASAPVNMYACLDGHVFTGALLDSHWKIIAREIGRDDLADLPLAQRNAQRSTTDGALSEYCAKHEVAYIVEHFSKLGLAATKVNQFSDLAKEPHMVDRDMLVPVTLADGQEVPLVGPAVKFSRTPTKIRSSAPVLGQDNEAILAELDL